MKRFLWLGVVAFLLVIWTGCGDTFRPVIIPNPPAFPDPRAAHSVMTVNDNGLDRGSNMVIDVSGDTESGVGDMGVAPVHAVQQTASQVLVVNHSFANAQGDSLTRINFFGTTISNTTTITLPANSAPNFVATTETAQAYVLLPNLVPDPINSPGVVVPSFGVVNTSSNTLAATVAVGNGPVAMAETPDKNKLYVANQGDGTVSAFNTIDRSPRNPAPIAIASPTWILARSDSQRVYVLGNGIVTTLDTTSNAGPDTVVDASVSVPNATFMFYDSLHNRLYIPGDDPGSGAPQLVVVDVSASVPQVLARVPLPGPGVGVAALPDGSRAYAASNSNAQTTTIGTISSVSGDGATATYTYDPNSVTGPSPQLGMSLTISGGGDGFDGTFIVTAASAGMFQALNITNATSSDARSATGTNFLPQVTVINTPGNFIKTTVSMPAVPAAGPFEPAVCANTRFRFMMAVGGDSSRAYLSSCDAGNVMIIDTSTDTYIANLVAPASTRAPVPPNTQPPPQNPVFMIAGP